MARRNVLQEIPILVPQTEQQSYEIVSEEETSIPYNKQISLVDQPHYKYISNDESKENITPTQFENIFEKSLVKVLDGGNVGDLPDDEPGPSSSSQTSGAGNISTPKKKTEESSDDLPPCNTPIDFSTVTVGDLGISSESFTTKFAGKSPKSLHKHRRRSTIGVRGSPEMNFLIRQIALQRSNGKREPEPLSSQDNPFTSPRNSILREKISAFRSAFQAVEETEGKLSFPGFSEDEESESEEGKGEVRSEPPEKRKKVCDTTDLGVSSVLNKPSVTLCPSQLLESSPKFVPEKTLESDCSLASRLSDEVSSEPMEVQSDEAQMLQSSSRSCKRKVMFADLSPPEPEQPLKLETSSGPALKPVLKKTPGRDFAHFRVGFGEEKRVLFSLEESSDNEENVDINNIPEDSIKKKRVTFGRELSPELFDKTLPANTPLRRGSTPCDHHKLDATPSAEQSTCQSPCDPMPQPDFDDKDEEETLQPLSLYFDAESCDSDSPASPSLPESKEESRLNEEEQAAVLSTSSTDNELVKFYNETAEEIGTTVPLPNVAIVNESFITSPEVSPAGARKTRASNKRKLTSTEETLESNDSKAAVITKVKLTAKKTRIIKKVQIKAPSGKDKKKEGKSKKSIPKPVHSEREGISKKPLLSPILELPEYIPTPLASMSRVVPYVLLKHLVKKVHTQARAGKVQENNIHFTLEDSLERSIEGKDTARPLCVVEDVQTQNVPVDPALEDVKVSNSGSPEKSEDLLGCDVIVLADPVSRECPQCPMDMEVTDQLPPTCGLAPSSEKEKKSKTKNTKRRSSTRKYAPHVSESTHCATSEMTLERLKQDVDADHVSLTLNTSIDDPAQRTLEVSSMSNELSVEGTTTSSSKLLLSFVSTDHKKSRRSSRNHQVPNMLYANTEQNVPGENGSMLPHLVNHSDSSMNGFCLPIDEALQFPQQVKKVRRSMRLRGDSGVIGLSWVQENKGNEMTGRRKSLSSVMRLEESSEISLDNAVHSPNKENLSSYHMSNIARRTGRRSLCTTTVQESVSTHDAKRRRSGFFHKTPNTNPASDEDVHRTVLPEA